ARTHSRGRPRELIDQALARLAQADSGTAVQLSPIASEVVARVEAAPLPAPVPVRRELRPWATWSLTAVLAAVAGGIAIVFGDSGDPGVLVRGGAMVRGLIDGGEWWRLVTCVFIHVGMVHLAVNAIGMYFLGRVTEEMFGTARTLALFGLCGIAGAFASYLASPAGVSAGASGAIFGLLGAVFIELTWHRHKYRAAWKRGMWGGLVVVTIAQVGVGFLYPVIDQWAHGAGLFAGITFGALLSPSAPWATVGKHVARAIAVAFATASIVAGIFVAQTSIGDSLGAAPRVRHTVAEVAITAPATWLADNELADPDGLVLVTLRREPLQNLATQMTAWSVEAKAIGKARGFDDIAVPATRLIALPTGWEGTELVGSFEDALGNRQRYRVIVAGRAFGDTLIQLVIMTPDSIAAAAPDFFAQLVASAGPR
ncbi:MAG: rhomboid family intramembrane serine protease, partial [Deltaproteobacteria bacterium]|nr:rhomboid family intramembrane serine protease [Deltaproteobacteria bacterium]